MIKKTVFLLLALLLISGCLEDSESNAVNWFRLANYPDPCVGDNNVLVGIGDELTCKVIDVNSIGGSGGSYTSFGLPIVVDNDSNRIGLNVQPTSDWNGLFDGEEGTYYLDYNNFTNTPVIPIDTNVFMSGVSDCGAGEYLYGFNSDGTIDCRTDETGSGGYYYAGSNMTLGDGNYFNADLNGVMTELTFDSNVNEVFASRMPLTDANLSIPNVWSAIDGNKSINTSCDNNSDCTITGDITGATGYQSDTNYATEGYDFTNYLLTTTFIPSTAEWDNNYLANVWNTDFNANWLDLFTGQNISLLTNDSGYITSYSDTNWNTESKDFKELNDLNNIYDARYKGIGVYIPIETDIDANALAVINSLDLNTSLDYLSSGIFIPSSTEWDNNFALRGAFDSNAVLDSRFMNINTYIPTEGSIDANINEEIALRMPLTDANVSDNLTINGYVTDAIFNASFPVDYDTNISNTSYIPSESDIDANALAVINALDLNNSLEYLKTNDLHELDLNVLFKDDNSNISLNFSKGYYSSIDLNYVLIEGTGSSGSIGTQPFFGFNARTLIQTADQAGATNIGGITIVDATSSKYVGITYYPDTNVLLFDVPSTEDAILFNNNTGFASDVNITGKSNLSGDLTLLNNSNIDLNKNSLLNLSIENNDFNIYHSTNQVFSRFTTNYPLPNQITSFDTNAFLTYIGSNQPVAFARVDISALLAQPAGTSFSKGVANILASNEAGGFNIWKDISGTGDLNTGFEAGMGILQIGGESGLQGAYALEKFNVWCNVTGGTCLRIRQDEGYALMIGDKTGTGNIGVDVNVYAKNGEQSFYINNSNKEVTIKGNLNISPDNYFEGQGEHDLNKETTIYSILSSGLNQTYDNNRNAVIGLASHGKDNLSIFAAIHTDFDGTRFTNVKKDQMLGIYGLGGSNGNKFIFGAGSITAEAIQDWNNQVNGAILYSLVIPKNKNELVTLWSSNEYGDFIVGNIDTTIDYDANAIIDVLQANKFFTTGNTRVGLGTGDLNVSDIYYDTLIAKSPHWIKSADGSPLIECYMAKDEFTKPIIVGRETTCNSKTGACNFEFTINHEKCIEKNIIIAEKKEAVAREEAERQKRASQQKKKFLDEANKINNLNDLSNSNSSAEVGVIGTTE